MSVAEAAGAKIRILIADDQQVHREMMRRAVDEANLGGPIEVVETDNGTAALSVLQSGVNIALLDIRMPGLTGLQVLAALRSGGDHASTPVIIVSSSMDTRDLAEAARHRAAAYVQKGRFPHFRNQLIDAMVKALGTDAKESPNQ